MRYIILDTETTGLDPNQGHKLVEVGAVEMIDRQLTGKHFHHYLNPERESVVATVTANTNRQPLAA